MKLKVPPDREGDESTNSVELGGLDGHFQSFSGLITWEDFCAAEVISTDPGMVIIDSVPIPKVIPKCIPRYIVLPLPEPIFTASYTLAVMK